MHTRVGSELGSATLSVARSASGGSAEGADSASLLQAQAVDTVREGMARRNEPAGRLGGASA